MTSQAQPEPLGLPVPRRSMRARRAWNVLALFTCVLAAGLLCVPITLLVWHLFVHGLPQLNLGFFVHEPKPVGELGGGMANAIVGTLILIGIGTAFAVPVGVGAGIYLAEYGESRFAGGLRYAVDVLGGVPSIVVGVAVYGLIVVPMARFSAIAGGVALGDLDARDHHPLDRGGRATGAAVVSARRTGAGRTALARGAGRGAARGAGRYHHRHHAVRRARRGRDRATVVHRARQSFLVREARPPDGVAPGA